MHYPPLALAKFFIKTLIKISLKFPKNSPHHLLGYSLRVIRYSLIAVLAVVLIVGSALQALISHQQAETTAITEPMRVQALVTIEGISDSVYDPSTNSGYRQVATIKHISPLVSELTVQDLNNTTINYIESYNNSLSNSNLNSDSNKNTKYRVLLNAYPKKSSTVSSKKTSKKSQIAAVNNLQPGDQLSMTLTLAPLATSQEAINNPSGFDSYRWLRSRHIDGVANIIEIGKPIAMTRNQSSLTTSSNSYLKYLRTRIDQWRWQLRQHFYQDWSQQTTAQQQAKAVTLSLLTGDRSLISRDTKDLYQLAGISHLLAISGTHVLFSAILLAGAAVLFFNSLCPVLYRYIPRWQVRWLVMISAAFIYALFTGFDVPAARTAWMLLAIGAVRLTLLPVSTMRVLLALAVLMVWFDPYVLWQAGYWLSFIAVGLLLKYDDGTRHTQNKKTVKNRHQRKNSQKTNVFYTKAWPLFKRIFKLQCWLFIALLPITLLLFGKASLWGLVINLFAIGLFGWLIVPLNLLAGLCYLLLPAVADSIWALVSAIVAGLHELITWLTTLPSLKGAWLYTPVNTGMLLMALLVLLPWLLPRGLISRWLALPPLTLLAMTIYANQQALSLTPTLYVLPTGDRYLSAAVLQYPVYDSEINESKTKDVSTKKDNKNKKSPATDNVSWLFLADHRGRESRTMPSSMTADKLSATLEQQLRTLSIKRLAGIIVQTSSIALTDTRAMKNEYDKKERDKKTRDNAKTSDSELLPMTVAQLRQRLPASQYWQAGRSDRWSTRQQVYTKASQSENRPYISAQRCEQGKIWQLANGNLTLQAMTGWPKIEDASVWDCTIAIGSSLPIKIVKYNATEPQRSPRLTGQALDQTAIFPSRQQETSKQESSQTTSTQTRIILDAATHQHIWQLWSLLCTAKPFSINNNPENSIIWLGHSASQVSAETLKMQGASEVITYDNEPLEVVLALGLDLGAEPQTD